MARTKDMDVSSRKVRCVAAKDRGLGREGQGASGAAHAFFLLPLREKVAREARRMRGLSPRIETPHPARRCFASAIHPLPQGGLCTKACACPLRSEGAFFE